ncbi:MAG: biotin--[acetyl-CoA-carboxylase] ligase [Ignavibacteria bacterium]|nr:biotin--[acetyl-CoA-carboxylase] ligase [Ignavibacteria bacterium]
MFDIELFRRKIKDIGLFEEIFFFDETISTNIAANEISNSGNAIVISDYQSSGKGRFDRKWESEKGENLTFTLKLKIDIPKERKSTVNFFFSYCIFSGIINFIKKYYWDIDTSPLNIKWPNDILWLDKKICGLLIETKSVSNEFIIGVGINVNQIEFDPAFNATSLTCMLKDNLSREILLHSVIEQIEAHFSLLDIKNYNGIFRLWRNSTKMIGNSCLYSIDGNTDNTCKIIDLNDDFSIELMINNAQARYYSGDIKLFVKQ